MQLPLFAEIPDIMVRSCTCNIPKYASQFQHSMWHEISLEFLIASSVVPVLDRFWANLISYIFLARLKTGD